MTIHGWKTRFREIRRDFGYSEREDLRSAKKLNSILKNKASKKQLQEIIENKTVVVIGAGPSLSKSVKFLKNSKNVTKIVADGAVRGLLEKNNTSTNKPKGITKLFVTANVELLTSTVPLFHIKYPKPVAKMPNHNMAITSIMPKDSDRL